MTVYSSCASQQHLGLQMLTMHISSSQNLWCVVAGIPNGAVSLPEMVRLSLEAAAGAAKGGSAAEPLIVEEGAHTLVKCLISASSATISAWQASSGGQLLGSTAVLQHLAANFPKQLDGSEGRHVMLNLLQARIGFLYEYISSMCQCYYGLQVKRRLYC